MKGHFGRVTGVRVHHAAAGAALVLVTALAAARGAGEIKVHDWPCAFLKQTIPMLEIPVVMDVVEVYRFFVGAGTVRLEPVGGGTYRGCSPLTVTCTFDLTLTCSIEPTGVVPGEYSCSVDPPQIDAPFGVATLCAEVKNARLDNLPAGKKVLQVAVIRIRVTPW